MGYKYWDDLELEILETQSDILSTRSLAKKLGRSVSAVALKRYRMGLMSVTDSGNLLSQNMVSTILGVENRTVSMWRKKLGLKACHRGSYIMYNPDELVKWLKANPDRWNAARVTDKTLFVGAEWFKAKARSDKPKNYNWTPLEIQQMKYLRKEGYTILEIAQKMQRSESSIKYKLYTAGGTK